MAPLVTHLVIGERVFTQLPQFGSADYGAFLLGCLLVDVNGFSDIDRRLTHFAGRLSEDGEGPLEKSCIRFLKQLDALLVRPYGRLENPQRAFVAGYLCHLAADEAWKAFGWNLMRRLGITSLAALPVPAEAITTVCSVLSAGMLVDFPSVTSALTDVQVPDVFTHVPHAAFQRMWSIVREHVLDGGTLESYFALLRRNGLSSAEVRAARHQHALHWDNAIDLLRDIGGIEPIIWAADHRSVETLPLLQVAF
jgi:hypothetical protein